MPVTPCLAAATCLCLLSRLFWRIIPLDGNSNRYPASSPPYPSPIPARECHLKFWEGFLNRSSPRNLLKKALVWVWQRSAVSFGIMAGSLRSSPSPDAVLFSAFTSLQRSLDLNSRETYSPFPPTRAC